MDDLTFTTFNAFLHHGIQGQKWGVKNGPPYPLDEKASSNSKSKTVNNDKKAINNTKIIFNDSKSDEARHLRTSACKLGLQALKKMGRLSFLDENDELFTKNNYFWFWEEDQTIGLPIIASLIDNGISRNKLSSMIKEAKTKSPYSEETSKMDNFNQEFIFGIREGYIGDDFIDACYEIKKKNKRR